MSIKSLQGRCACLLSQRSLAILIPSTHGRMAQAE